MPPALCPRALTQLRAGGRLHRILMAASCTEPAGPLGNALAAPSRQRRRMAHHGHTCAPAGFRQGCSLGPSADTAALRIRQLPLRGRQPQDPCCTLPLRAASSPLSLGAISRRVCHSAPGAWAATAQVEPAQARLSGSSGGAVSCGVSAAAAGLTAEGCPRSSIPLLSVAPMMDWTDVHFRQLARLLSRHTWLYTEMVVDQTVVHQSHNLDRFLAFPEAQRPVVLQLGGNSPESLGEAVALAARYDYDEININCGCPSEAVSGHGCFGARLMLDPQRVAAIAGSMASRSQAPVTVKCRIGVDDWDTYDHLYRFVEVVSSSSPVRHFIIHARKALLKGLSPAENRTVPPLKYEVVLALMRDFPHLQFSLNGGITTLQQARAALSYGVHGVMIGRAAYHTPWQILGPADTLIFGAEANPAVSRRRVLEEYCAYTDSALNCFGRGRPNVQTLVKPVLGLFYGEKGGARFRRAIDACVRQAQVPSDVIAQALAVVPEDVLDAPPHCDEEDVHHLPLGPLPETPVAAEELELVRMRSLL